MGKWLIKEAENVCFSREILNAECLIKTTRNKFIITAPLLPEGGAKQDSTGFPKNEGKERKENKKIVVVRSTLYNTTNVALVFLLRKGKKMIVTRSYKYQRCKIIRSSL